ncbi:MULTISPECIES: hypothetical protein [unclassified Pseudoclavibacter]|uniref:hypothetical protein n=1 Tax=unclassified Pseudoclavibacter TaxID=2615177 RepID=UPI0015CC6BB8|nr:MULTISPECIES: hypothetical protein [unclassified Pseudoclavibacter]MBS3179912.1 hypothetical protein [Pseudoclavibacter sp. Marseille-Q4354]NYF14255.1 hypothetical protein [Pseudoclavibacter sp. JAI123]
MPETRIDQEAESRQAIAADGFWDAYQRRTLPIEALAICGTGLVISVGIITAITTLF